MAGQPGHPPFCLTSHGPRPGTARGYGRAAPSRVSRRSEAETEGESRRWAPERPALLPSSTSPQNVCVPYDTIAALLFLRPPSHSISHEAAHHQRVHVQQPDRGGVPVCGQDGRHSRSAPARVQRSISSPARGGSASRCWSAPSRLSSRAGANCSRGWPLPERITTGRRTR